MAKEDQVKYRAKCLTNSIAESKEKQTPGVKLQFLLLYNIETPNIPENKIVYADLWLSDAVFEKSMHTLTKVMGWKGNNLTEVNENNTLFQNVEVILVCEPELYNGKTTLKVKFVNPLAKRLDEEAMKNLDAKLAGKFAAYKAKSPTVTGGREPGQDDAEPLPNPDSGF